MLFSQAAPVKARLNVKERETRRSFSLASRSHRQGKKEGEGWEETSIREFLQFCRICRRISKKRLFLCRGKRELQGNAIILALESLSLQVAERERDSRPSLTWLFPWIESILLSLPSRHSCSWRTHASERKTL